MKVITAINAIICAAIFGTIVGFSLKELTKYPHKQVQAGIIKVIGTNQ